jgi:hypothetical protein
MMEDPAQGPGVGPSSSSQSSSALVLCLQTIDGAARSGRTKVESKSEPSPLLNAATVAFLSPLAR